jgi:hypothetical protein
MKRPSCKWSQDDEKIHILVELINIDNDCFFTDLNENTFTLTYKEYNLEIHFYNKVNNFVHVNGLIGQELIFSKDEKIFWPRLTEENQSFTKSWLQINWNRWVDEEDFAKHHCGKYDDRCSNFSSSSSDNLDRDMDDDEIRHKCKKYEKKMQKYGFLEDVNEFSNSPISKKCNSSDVIDA